MLERFASWWIGAEDGPSTQQKTPLALVGCLTAICIAVAFVGVPRMRLFGHDVFVSLDGGWRVLHGQRPVVDFFAQMGPAYYLLHAAGLRLAGFAARGLGYGTTFVAVLISGWSFFLLRRRMMASAFVLTSIGLVLLAVAPFPLGNAPWDTSFAMKHNRYEFAITGIVFLECFLPSSTEDGGKKQFAGGFSSGLACSLLVFLKISYGLVAVGLLAVSVAFRRQKFRRVAAIVAGLACFTIPMLAYLHFDVRALLREYRLLAQVRGSGVRVSSILNRWYQDRFEVSLLPVLAVLSSFLPGIPVRRRIELLAATALGVGAGTLLLLTNTQASMYPLNTVMALIVMNEVASLRHVCAPLVAAPLLAIGALIVAVPLCLDASGLVLAVGDKLLRPDVAAAGGYQLEGSHLAALEFFEDRGVSESLYRNDNGQPFVEITNEGFALLRGNTGPTESVRGMGLSNPFSYGLLRPPSRGGSVVIAQTDVSKSAVPPLDLLVGNADLLLIPKFPDLDRDTLQIIIDTYPDLLGTLYLQVAESEHWKLYRRVRADGAHD